MKISEIKRLSKSALSGNWGIVIGVFIIIGVLTVVSNGITQTGGIVGLLLSVAATICIIPVLHTGQVWLNLDIYDQKDASISGTFSAFAKEAYTRVVITNLLIGVYTFLWTLLFIVPGIIKFFSYSQTLYILKDNPELSPNQAITRSREIMNGHKWRLCVLTISFVWWILLPILPFIWAWVEMSIGILIIATLFASLYYFLISFYLAPYFNITMVGFYREVVLKSVEKIGLVEE